MAEKGNLYIISAPSGAGKTTLVKALVNALSGITVSVSHTTRKKRDTEQHGVNYYFIDDSAFKDMITRHEFLEHATVFEHYYGTSRAWVEETLNCGIDVILEIDWQGCQQIQRLFPGCISIFILPPSLTALSERLTTRDKDQATNIRHRLDDVKETMQHIHEYNYIIVNDQFDTAVNDLKSIIQAERLRTECQMKKLTSLLTELSVN